MRAQYPQQVQSEGLGGVEPWIDLHEHATMVRRFFHSAEEIISNCRNGSTQTEFVHSAKDILTASGEQHAGINRMIELVLIFLCSQNNP